MALFPTTSWNCVAEAGDRGSPGADAALAEICRGYWFPVYSFIRSRGHSADEAADLTQEYFARLLQSRLLAAADSRKGRFRALVRADCANFLADQRDRRLAHKRGGSRVQFSLDVDDADRRYRLEPADGLDPGRLFDRAWVLETLVRALDRVGRQEAQGGRGAAFERLKSVLTEDRSNGTYSDLAEELGTTPVAIRSTVQRLRRRYRRALRDEVAATLADPTEADVDEEIRALFAALGR
jgi:DNA-directed RNA polymerase specialized sigma24 family protein